MPWPRLASCWEGTKRCWEGTKGCWRATKPVLQRIYPAKIFWRVVGVNWFTLTTAWFIQGYDTQSTRNPGSTPMPKAAATIPVYGFTGGDTYAAVLENFSVGSAISATAIPAALLASIVETPFIALFLECLSEADKQRFLGNFERNASKKLTIKLLMLAPMVLTTAGFAKVFQLMVNAKATEGNICPGLLKSFIDGFLFRLDQNPDTGCPDTMFSFNFATAAIYAYSVFGPMAMTIAVLLSLVAFGYLVKDKCQKVVPVGKNLPLDEFEQELALIEEITENFYQKYQNNPAAILLFQKAVKDEPMRVGFHPPVPGGTSDQSSLGKRTNGSLAGNLSITIIPDQIPTSHSPKAVQEHTDKQSGQFDITVDPLGAVPVSYSRSSSIRSSARDLDTSPVNRTAALSSITGVSVLGEVALPVDGPKIDEEVRIDIEETVAQLTAAKKRIDKSINLFIVATAAGGHVKQREFRKTITAIHAERKESTPGNQGQQRSIAGMPPDDDSFSINTNSSKSVKTPLIGDKQTKATSWPAWCPRFG